MKIEWEPIKARVNLKMHGVPFQEAATALSDVLGDPSATRSQGGKNKGDPVAGTNREDQDVFGKTSS
jgi:uncharacterized DUF497 family protein